MPGRNTNASVKIAAKGKNIPDISASTVENIRVEGRSSANELNERPGSQEQVPSQVISAPARREMEAPSYGSVDQQVGESAQQEQQTRPSTIKEMDQRIRSELGQLASPPSYAAVPNLPDTALQSDRKALERIATTEDTPRPHETGNASMPAWTPGEINAMQNIERERQQANRLAEKEAVTNVEDAVEQAADEAAVNEVEESTIPMRSAESRERYEAAKQAAPDPTRTKPSIFDRLIGRQPRTAGHRNTENMSTTRPADVVNGLMSQISRHFGTHGVGFRIYGKINPLPMLGFRDVGIGIQELKAVVDQNADMLDELIMQSIPEEERGVTFTSSRTMLIGELADFINSHNIEVFTAKPPNNRGQDVQRRVLKVLEGIPRGIFLHPYAAAMYTADFDGDDMEISFDPKARWGARDPMAHMVGIDGEQSFDMKFVPISEIKDDPDLSRWDYVKTIMLDSWTRRIEEIAEDDAGYNSVHDSYGKLIESILKISDAALKDSDSQAKAYGDMFRAARDFADIMASRGKAISDSGIARSSDRIMSDVTRAVIDGMRNLKVDQALASVGEVIPRDQMPPALTNSDSALYSVLDGMVSGATPNNFQELKVMMNGFLGNVADKNAPFRFTADVGKMMKLDKRYLIGEYYVIPQDDDSAMTDLLQKTLKYKYSRRMTVDVKTAGRSMYFTEVLSQRVIEEVGMPDDVVILRDVDGKVIRKNGEPVMGRRTLGQFITDFVRSYNKHSSIINQANMVWLANMGILAESNRKTVTPIKNARDLTALEMRDLATPFIDVYGNFSLERMFYGRFGTFEDHPRKENIIGTDLVRENNFVSVKARYANMSLKAFSVNNIIRLSKSETDHAIHTTIRYKIRKQLYDTTDADLAASLIIAMADKKTSVASKFNKNVLGMFESREGRRDRVALEGDDHKKTVVANMCDLLMDLRRLDTEGKLIEPLPTMSMVGYYAGIGSRNVPDDVRQKMTEVAAILRDKGMHLRSGHAKGADQAFEAGAGNDATVYLPKTNFEEDAARFGGARYLTFEDMNEDDRRAAEDSVIKYHPWGKSLRERYRSAGTPDDKSAFGYMAHRRNYYQIMGSGGEQASAFVVCWTPVSQSQDWSKVYNKLTRSYEMQQNDRPTGTHGTDQAIRIARANNIPVFNAAEYDNLDDWANDVIEAATALIEKRLYRDGSADQMLKVENAIMALNASNYEMFRDFGMDTVAGFLTSEFGKALIRNADNPEVVASIREAMVFAWKTQRITRISSELREMRASADPKLSRYMDLMNQARFSMNELSESSYTWRGLMKEIRTNKTKFMAFKQLQTKEGRGKALWEAPDFWLGNSDYAKPSDYKGIRDVIEDLNMPWPLKCDIITDVVRWQTNYTSLKSFEIGYQLEVGGNARYSIDSVAPKSPMTVFNDMESASTRYANRGMRNMVMEVQKAAYHHRDKENHLINTLKRLVNCPWECVSIDDRMYADGILAVREKTYAQTEKAKKHPFTNALYNAISLQRNGGQFNDVYRFDDRLLGLQHKSKLSARDIARVLYDPSYVLSVYDDDGAVGYLTQGLLLGIDHEASEQELWDWLIANPRIAGTLRQGAACVIADTKSKGFIGANLSLDETMTTLGSFSESHDIMGNVKYLMRDHPVYGGLIALLSPAHGTVVRNERNRIPVTEETICELLYRKASDDSTATDVLNELGITIEKMQELLTSDFDKYMEMLGFGKTKRTTTNAESATKKEVRSEAEDIYNTLNTYINKYLAEIRENVPLGKEILRNTDASTVELGMDLESIASFWDTIQELSGAKVAVSTGVEGRETYDLAYWVSHMGAKDRYADLEAIENLIASYDDPMQFNGQWTNKGPFVVSIDGNGSVITNIGDLTAMKNGDGDCVVVEVPDGFIVPDRSTDTHGNPVPSLYAAMVSKRANGAEKFNLKAMKAGLDGTDSISKMREKYSMVQYSNGQMLPTFILELRQQLADIASQGGIQAAREELAKMMMNQDYEMGYKDMGLANYMCLAEVMLIDDGQNGIILRSLEQITTALRGRIGARAVNMSDDEISETIQKIVADTGEQGIGRLRVWDSNELLSNMRPNGASNGAHVSMKVASSVFSNNLDLLDKIMKEDAERGNNVGIFDLDDAKSIHRHVTTNVEGVTDVYERSEVARNYMAISFIGEATDKDEPPKEGEYNESVGPLFMTIVGDGKIDENGFNSILDRAYDLGMTVLISANHVDKVPEKYAADLIPASDDGDMLLPMFDMRLNGSEAMPFEPHFAIFQVPHTRYLVSAEDPYNVYELGDAQYKFTSSAINQFHAWNSGTQTLTAVQLFPNVFSNEAYKDCTFQVGFPDRSLIDNLIVNPDNPKCTIDYGAREGDPGFGQQVHNVNKAIERYKENLQMVSDDKGMGFIYGPEVSPGDIVMWSMLRIYRNGKKIGKVLAPVIPFPLHGTKTNPERFNVIQIGMPKNDGSQISVDWAFQRPMSEGGFVKVFDSSGGANKGMVNLSDPIDGEMTIKNGGGIQVHAYCAAESTDSRKIGTDRRIKTMISLMAAGRIRGYNFARLSNAFPDDEDLREIANTRVGREVWTSKLSTDKPIRFLSGRTREVKRMNAFLNYEVRKIYENGGNPTDYLACMFTDENGNDFNSHVMWEFECMFSNSLNYEDALLKFMNLVDPNLCPRGIDDDSEDKMFRLYPGDGYDRGILQAKVPYLMSNTRQRVAYVWSNIAIGMSFFGEESSYNSRPNVVGASDMLDSANTRAYYDGIQGLTPRKQSLRAAWATAEEGWPPEDAGAIGSLRW